MAGRTPIPIGRIIETAFDWESNRNIILIMFIPDAADVGYGATTNGTHNHRKHVRRTAPRSFPIDRRGASMSSQLTETAQVQGELWSDAGQDWSERFAPSFGPVWSACHDLARVTTGTRLLDIGCGCGGALGLARLRGAELTGLDAAPDLLGIARRRLPDGSFRTGDMEHLPYEDETFDAVTLINSIMYAADPAEAIREAGRVLAPDGRLAMAVWAEPAVCEFRHVMEAMRAVMPDPPEGDGPFTLAGAGALESVMEESGVDPVEVREVKTPFTFADEAHYLQAHFGTGPVQGVLRQVDESTVTEALLDVGERFRQYDGAYQLENTFRVVAATPSDR